MKILVVDEDAVRGPALVKRAESLGHACALAQDATEGWQHLAGPSDIDLVIAAWSQPAVSGRELCKRIRERAGRYLPVLALVPADAKAEQLDAMRAGADDLLLDPVAVHELQLRLLAAERLIHLHRRIVTQADELRRLHGTLFDQGRVDVVTGIPNRLRLEEDAEHLYDQAVKLGLGYSLAMIDVDWFKSYNDTYGHQRGDDVLRAIASAIDGSSRAGDQAYRYGGEEFVLVLQTDDAKAAARICERVREAVEELALAHPRSPGGRVTISVGVATMNPYAPRAVHEVLSRADAAMYRAKREGRNRVASWDPSTDQLLPEPPAVGGAA